MGILYTLHTKLSDSAFQEPQFVIGLPRSVHWKSGFSTHTCLSRFCHHKFWRKETTKILIMIDADILKHAFLCSHSHELLESGVYGELGNVINKGLCVW